MPQKYPLPPDWRSRVIAAACTLAIGKCEDAPNRGQIPDSCVRDNAGTLGDFWCMHAQCKVFRRSLGLASPLLKSGSCEQQRQRAKTKGALRTRKEFDAVRAVHPMEVAGWLALCIGPDDQGKPHAHHVALVGVVTDDGALTVTGPRGGFLTVEGNAADPNAGASRNGDGMYAGRERGHSTDATEYEFVDPLALSMA